MGTRAKKDRRKAKRAAAAGWRVGTPVFDFRETDALQEPAARVICDATGDDLIISEVSEKEFAEAARGYLVGGTVKLPGGGEIVIVYPDDTPGADPSHPSAVDFAASALGDCGTEQVDEQNEQVDEPLMGKPEIMDIDSALAACKQWVETILGDGTITAEELEGFGVFYFPCSERIERYLSAQHGMTLSPEKKSIIPWMWLAHRNGLITNFDRSLLPTKDRIRLERLLNSAHFGSNPRAAFRRLANDSLLFLEGVA